MYPLLTENQTPKKHTIKILLFKIRTQNKALSTQIHMK